MSARNWTTIKEYTDIRFEFFEGIGKITINRPQVYNAFRPETNKEMIDAMDIAREDPRIGVVVFTGEGDKAFCSGGDQNVKGRGGYIGTDGIPRLNVLDLHKRIRELPKPVVAMVNGYAIGGGHVLHVVCDLTIAADHARFGQTGPKVGSFDAGFGSNYLARHVGQKKAREIWFLCLQYSAQEAFDMGMVNKVVPLAQLEDTTVEWCNIMMQRSPLALRMIKRGLNAELDGQRTGRVRGGAPREAGRERVLDPSRGAGALKGGQGEQLERRALERGERGRPGSTAGAAGEQVHEPGHQRHVHVERGHPGKRGEVQREPHGRGAGRRAAGRGAAVDRDRGAEQVAEGARGPGRRLAAGGPRRGRQVGVAAGQGRKLERQRHAAREVQAPCRRGTPRDRDGSPPSRGAKRGRGAPARLAAGRT